MNRSVLGTSPVERRRRVLSIGAASLQLLAIQHKLNEGLNLNGDTLLALLDGSIVPCKIEGSAALDAMFLTTDPLELKHRRRWDLDRFSQHKLESNAAHTIYDSSLRPPTFKRLQPSINPPCPILFSVTTLTTVPSNTIPPSMSNKRENDGGAPEEPQAKRGKKSKGRTQSGPCRRSQHLAGSS
jgi:hypothetical protein